MPVPTTLLLDLSIGNYNACSFANITLRLFNHCTVVGFIFNTHEFSVMATRMQLLTTSPLGKFLHRGGMHCGVA